MPEDKKALLPPGLDPWRLREPVIPDGLCCSGRAVRPSVDLRERCRRSAVVPYRGRSTYTHADRRRACRGVADRESGAAHAADDSGSRPCRPCPGIHGVMTDVALLINPAAGRGRGRRVGAEAAAQLRRSGVKVRELVGSGPDRAAELARSAVADGVGALVVCGGDGIVHIALQAIAGTATPLGVIPAGSGNDFARAIGVPLRDVAAAVAIVVAGVAIPVDLARAGDRWFGTVLASGFDSKVNDRMNTMRWPRGRTRYHAAIVSELVAFRPLPFVVEIDGSRREFEAMFVAVGNGASYGGGMRICPSAQVDDGLLDVTVVSRISRVKLVRLFPTVYPGRHVLRPEVLTFRCASVTVSAPDVAGYADGEFVADLPLTCSVVSAAVQVLSQGLACPGRFGHLG